MKVVQIVSLLVYVLIFLDATSGIILNKEETLIGEEDRRGADKTKKTKNVDQEKANTASRGLWAVGQVEKGHTGYHSGYADVYNGQGTFAAAGPDNLGYPVGTVGLHEYNTRPPHGHGQDGYKDPGHPSVGVGLNYGHNGGGEGVYGYSEGGGLGYDHGGSGIGHGHSGGGIGYGHIGGGVGYGYSGSGIGHGQSGGGVGNGHSGAGIGYGHSGAGISYGHSEDQIGYGGGTDYTHSGGGGGYGHKGGEIIYGHSGGGLNYGHSGGELTYGYGGGAYGGSGLGSIFGKKLPLKKLLLPIAGLALLGAAAALTTKPILLQLGTISGRKRRSVSNGSSEELYPRNPFVRPMGF